jgi:hypothetical protein
LCPKNFKNSKCPKWQICPKVKDWALVNNFGFQQNIQIYDKIQKAKLIDTGLEAFL